MLSNKGSTTPPPPPPPHYVQPPALKFNLSHWSSHPERYDPSLTLKGSRKGPPLSSAKSSDCCPCGAIHRESEPVRARPAGPNIEGHV